MPQNHCCDSVPKMKGHIKICTVLLLCCGWAPKAHFCVLQSAHCGEIIFEGTFLFLQDISLVLIGLILSAREIWVKIEMFENNNTLPEIFQPTAMW